MGGGGGGGDRESQDKGKNLLEKECLFLEYRIFADFFQNKFVFCFKRICI